MFAEAVAVVVVGVVGGGASTVGIKGKIRFCIVCPSLYDAVTLTLEMESVQWKHSFFIIAFVCITTAISVGIMIMIIAVVSFYHVQDVIRMSQLRENVWRAIASMFHSVFISIVTTLVCCRLSLPLSGAAMKLYYLLMSIWFLRLPENEGRKRNTFSPFCRVFEFRNQTRA